MCTYVCVYVCVCMRAYVRVCVCARVYVCVQDNQVVMAPPGNRKVQGLIPGVTT